MACPYTSLIKQSVFKNGSLDLGHWISAESYIKGNFFSVPPTRAFKIKWIGIKTFIRFYVHLFSESLEDPPDEAPPPPPQESSESETDDVETVIDAEEKQDVNSVQDIPNGKPDEKEANLDNASLISSKSKFNLFTNCNCKCTNE